MFTRQICVVLRYHVPLFDAKALVFADALNIRGAAPFSLQGYYRYCKKAINAVPKIIKLFMCLLTVRVIVALLAKLMRIRVAHFALEFHQIHYLSTEFAKLMVIQVWLVLWFLNQLSEHIVDPDFVR